MTDRLKQNGAANDLTIAVEFLMGATRCLIAGKSVENPEVQEQLNWALRKIIPLDTMFRYGAESAHGGKGSPMHA